ncbi:MAG TPA: helix-turn-helix domain-containing protein [Acidimicrobiales bacterium]|jgi:hypothetical protein
MPHRSDSRLLVLHGLRLKGVASAAAVAAAVGLPPATVAEELGSLVELGWVVQRDGLLSGFTLTDAGRTGHERALADELVTVGARSTVETGYDRFRRLNPGVLDACSRWQVRQIRGQLVRNDHGDARHDARVLADLDAALTGVRPVGERLAAALDRFSPYAPQLEDALDRVRSGDPEYVTRPIIPSFHTVWFELHEDLLVTLGLDRVSEIAGAGGGN